MATTNGGPAPAATKPPQLNILAQYTKDLSFENPNAPRSLQPPQQGQPQPTINIQVNCQAKQLSDTDFEVELKIDGKAETSGTLLFGVELTYAGVFRVQNVPEENKHPIVMIECPRLMFPFAREIVANTVRQGGFPPLMLDPIDFVQLYQQRMTQAPAQAASPPKA